jgi:hypothetical protein
MWPCLIVADAKHCGAAPISVNRRCQIMRVKRLAIRFGRTFAHKIEASFRTRKSTMILIKISLLLIATGLRARTIGPNSRCAPNCAPPLCKASGILE